MKREEVMRKVQGLLDKADSTPYSDERDSLRAKADSMMLSYAIEDWQLKQAGGQAEEPTKRHFRIIGANNPLWSQLADLAQVVGEHCRCRVVTHGLRLAKDGYPCNATFVGFPADTEYAEVLFTSLHLQLAREMEPSPDPELSTYDNITLLRGAGIPWERVKSLLDINASTTQQWRKWLKSNRPDQAAELVGNNPASYRRSYADGFVTEVSRRFIEMRKAQEESGESTGTNALALRDRDHEVDEALRAFFPKLNKSPARPNGRISAAGFSRGSEAGRRADLSGGRGGLSGERKGLHSNS